MTKQGREVQINVLLPLLTLIFMISLLPCCPGDPDPGEPIMHLTGWPQMSLWREVSPEYLSHGVALVFFTVTTEWDD